MNCKIKFCNKCNIKFKPSGPRSIFCKKCYQTCSSCSKKISRGNKKCRKCGIRDRVFKLKCSKCLVTFEAKNQFKRECWTCNPKIKYCLNCKIKLSSNKRLRCNSCNSKYLRSNNIGTFKGWKKYTYKGIQYRSKWEILFANYLNLMKIKFEYEKYNKEKKSYPDFYLNDLNFYVEIHPDYHGIKNNLPKNCILLKDEMEIVFFSLVLLNMTHGKNYESIRKNIKRKSAKALLLRGGRILANNFK